MVVLRIIVLRRQIASPRRRLPPKLSLDEKLHVDRAISVFSEAIVERVIEPVEVERFAATRVGPVEERAMLGLLGRHNATDSVRNSHLRGPKARCSFNGP
jgi:hypothetical protein